MGLVVTAEFQDGEAPVVLPRPLQQRHSAVGHHLGVATGLEQAATRQLAAALAVVRAERWPPHGDPLLDRAGSMGQEPAIVGLKGQRLGQFVVDGRVLGSGLCPGEGVQRDIVWRGTSGPLGLRAHILRFMNVALDPHRNRRGDPILQFQGLI